MYRIAPRGNLTNCQPKNAFRVTIPYTRKPLLAKGFQRFVTLVIFVRVTIVSRETLLVTLPGDVSRETFFNCEICLAYTFYIRKIILYVSRETFCLAMYYYNRRNSQEGCAILTYRYISISFLVFHVKHLKIKVSYARCH